MTTNDQFCWNRQLAYVLNSIQ